MAARTSVRLELRLNPSEWVRIFDPYAWTIFVPTDKPVDAHAPLCVELDVGGWTASLRGIAVAARCDPAGVVVGIAATERAKINYLNGFVRGGLLNRRARRRLAIRLPVTYGAIEGPANAFTKDINEGGLFLVTDRPLPETSQVHLLIAVPGKSLSVMGHVCHRTLGGIDEPPGMGIAFERAGLEAAEHDAIADVIQELAHELARRPV